jgi:PAS domain S-box-containing protein
VTASLLELLLVQQLLASDGDGLIAFDPESRCLFWNPAMERISGLKAADVIGQRLIDLFPFLVETGEDRCLRRALAGEEVGSRDRPFQVLATNRRGFFDGHYRPLRDQTGAVIGGIARIRDITERKEAEQRQAETETRFRHMADASPVLLWMSETNGLCTFFNQTWLGFTGRTLEEEWGVGWAEGVHFEDFQRCMDTYIEAFGRRRVFEMEYRLRRADGVYRWLLDRGTPRYTPEGVFAGYIGSCVDITERKEAEAELLHAVEQRDQFLAIASHELRTPLTPLQLQVDRLDRLLRRSGGRAVPHSDMMEMTSAVKQQVARMTDLVSVLLDVSRVACGELHLDSSELDVADVVRATVERWRPSAEKAGCQLVLRLEETVPGYGDRLRLDQVLNNLLSNAIKYGPGRPIEVELRVESETIALVVSDHGIGISRADQARIFERFERASPARNYGGFGLGLWICRELVRAMGGVIHLDSVPGQGARFRIELPRLRPGAAAGSAPAAAQHPMAGDDDELLNRKARPSHMLS